MSHEKHRRLAALGALLPILLLGACSRPAPATEDIRPVRVMTVAPAATAAVVELAGEVRPRVESRLGFQVAGRITGRRVDVGDRVKQGQALALLDAEDYRLGAAAAQATMAAAQVDRDQQRADYKRFEELARKGFISGTELEQRRAALDAAEARYEAAAAQARVSGNQAGYAVLTAPTAGIVTAVDAEVGQVVAAGQSVLRVARDGGGEMEVAVALPESRLALLRDQREAQVRLWVNGPELRGRVREIAPIADAATRTYPARITLLDPPPGVALGMTATVRFVVPAAQGTLAVPLQALLRDGERSYVWKLDSGAGTVHRHEVQLAGIAGSDPVIASGVQPGDVLVTAGVHLLQEGQKVRVLQEPQAPAPAGVPITRPQTPVAPGKG